MTCGPYRPVTLRIYRTRIQDVYPRVYIDPSIGLKVDVELNGRPSADVYSLRIKLAKPSGEILLTETRTYDSLEQSRYVKLDNVISWDHLEDKGVELWWPFTYGRQPLYDLAVDVLDQVSILEFKQASFLDAH
jgi:beta-mannosidase